LDFLFFLQTAGPALNDFNGSCTRHLVFAIPQPDLKKRGVLGVARHHKQKRRERSGCGGGRFKFRYFSIPSFFFLLASSFSVGRTIPVFSFYTRGAPEYKNPKGRSQTTTGSNLNHGVEKKDEIGINARIFPFLTAGNSNDEKFVKRKFKNGHGKLRARFKRWGIKQQQPKKE
jgi:hypothetical protein